MLTFLLIVVAIILGLVAPDQWGRYFSPGWGLAWEKMLFMRCYFSWGLVMLASLYHDFHEFTYCDNRATGAGVTLLHIQAWEHIAVLRSRVTVVDVELDRPYKWVIDEMTTFTWRPWLGMPAWYDDVEQIFYVRQDRIMQGCENTMIERYLLDRVAKQFRDIQDRPDDQYMAIFALSTRERTWGQMIPTIDVIDSFRQMVAEPWAYDQGQVDLGTTHAYDD